MYLDVIVFSPDVHSGGLLLEASSVFLVSVDTGSPPPVPSYLKKSFFLELVIVPGRVREFGAAFKSHESISTLFFFGCCLLARSVPFSFYE